MLKSNFSSRLMRDGYFVVMLAACYAAWTLTLGEPLL